MSYQIVFSPQAEEDLEEAVDWYDGKKPGLGFDFAIEVEEGLTIIQRSPNAFAYLHGDVRAFVLKRFPYSILYRVLDSRAEVEIAAIVDQRQDPDKWQWRV